MELNGLRNIIGNCGSSGGMSMPPERCNYATGEEYAVAYEAWQARMAYWTARRVPLDAADE